MRSRGHRTDAPRKDAPAPGQGDLPLGGSGDAAEPEDPPPRVPEWPGEELRRGEPAWPGRTTCREGSTPGPALPTVIGLSVHSISEAMPPAETSAADLADGPVDDDLDFADDPDAATVYRMAYNIARARRESNVAALLVRGDPRTRDFDRELRALRQSVAALGDFGRTRRAAIARGIADAEAEKPPSW